MNIEKIAIIAIIALGIAGSAALAAGGHIEPLQLSGASISVQDDTAFESAQPTVLLQNTMFEFLGM